MVPAGWVAGIRYKPGWEFKVGGPGGRFLCVFARTPDSLQPDRLRVTQHMFEIPESGDLGRWVLDCLLLAERHEACEFLELDGVRRFWPHHQDEGSPYDLVDRVVHNADGQRATLPVSDRAG